MQYSSLNCSVLAAVYTRLTNICPTCIFVYFAFPVIQYPVSIIAYVNQKQHG